MNKLIMSVKKMPRTVLFAWLFLLALYVALFVAVPAAAMIVAFVMGVVWAIKRLADYYTFGG